MIDPTRVRTLVLFREFGTARIQYIIDIFAPDQSKCGVNEGTICACFSLALLRAHLIPTER